MTHGHYYFQIKQYPSGKMDNIDILKWWSCKITVIIIIKNNDTYDTTNNDGLKKRYDVPNTLCLLAQNIYMMTGPFEIVFVATNWLRLWSVLPTRTRISPFYWSNPKISIYLCQIFLSSQLQVKLCIWTTPCFTSFFMHNE